MTKQTRFGISWRLSVLTSLLILAGFSILSTAYFIYSKDRIQQRMEIDANNTLELARTSLAHPVWVFDHSAIKHTSDTLIEHSHGSLLALRVTSNYGQKLTEKFSPNVRAKTLEELLSDSSNSLYTKEIEYQAQVIGKIEVVLSSAVMDANLYDLFLKMISLTGFTVLVSSILVFFITHRMLASPIRNLVNIAERIQHGDYDIEEEKWKHEFRILSRAFAVAAQAIQRRDHELKMHAENLEFQVGLRTRELDAQRMKMVTSSHLASLGEISAGIAHEINNPLAIIQGKTEIMMKHVAHDPVQTGHLQKISQMVTRISKIVKGLRTFARDGSKDPMYAIDIKPFIEEVTSLCQARIKNQNIQFTVQCEPDLEGYGREVQLSQVLINLINNSIDAIENLPEKWIRLEVFQRDTNFVFAVTDSGKGIPESIRQKIMEPFFTTKSIGRGTGLGLSISIGIARDHGGDLVYVEHEGHTRFEVILPIPQHHLLAS